jgi:hypothetical protein
MRRNPRKVTWTVFYRRKHKKGIEEEAAKKRTRRTHKFQRAIVGASLSEIQAKRNMKPEVRNYRISIHTSLISILNLIKLMPNPTSFASRYERLRENKLCEQPRNRRRLQRQSRRQHNPPNPLLR